MGNHVIFENVLIQKLEDTIAASEKLTQAVVEKRPTEGAIGCFSVMRHRLSDAHTDMMHNTELAKHKQETLNALVLRLKHIRDFHENEYKKIEPLEAISPQIFERMNMNLEISRIRTIENYVKSIAAQINTMSYEQVRGGGSSGQALTVISGMILARKETIKLEAINKKYHTDGTLAYCFESNRQTAAQQFHQKVDDLFAQPHGQFEIMLQYDPQASIDASVDAPPPFDPFSAAGSSRKPEVYDIKFT